jgi:hypothetical protein
MEDACVAYLERLSQAFQLTALAHVMCRQLVSIA